MSFKETIQIEIIKQHSNEIYSLVDGIDEFGYVTIPSEEINNLKERSNKLIIKLKECEEELNKLNDEMQDYYSY